MTENEFFEYLNKNCNMKLTKQQYEAVVYNKGHHSIESTAGSGKTCVIVTKVAYMILVCNIQPNKIAVTSFSRASASDIKDRFYSYFGELIKDKIMFSTIHSFAYSIIRSYEKLTHTKYTIIEDNKVVDKNKVLKDIFLKYNNRPAAEDELQELISNITYIRNMMIYYKDLDAYEGNLGTPNFKKIYKEYSTFLNKNKYLDYDSILTMANHILSINPYVRNMYQKRFDYYLNDESQDNSKIQNSIIKQLAGNKIIGFIGDSDQSIYGWRGVDFREFGNFANTYKDAKILVMGQNFRSTPNIVNLANMFIKKNKNRYDKNIYTENPVGEDVVIGSVIDEYQQSDYVINQVKSGKKEYKQYAVLYRNNISAIAIIDKLHNANIPFYIKDEVTSFFNNRIVRDILNFIKVARNPRDIESFKRIYYKCSFYIKKDMIDNLSLIQDCDIFDTLYLNKELSSGMQERCLDMKEHFQLLSELHPSRAVDYIQNELNYREYLEGYFKDEKAMEMVNSTIATLKVILASVNDLASIEAKLEKLLLLMVESKNNIGQNSVTLSTIHSSKGLEWDEVFLIDTHALPSASAIKNYNCGDIAEMEEEVRCEFVAITRPRKKLHILQVLTNNESSITPSPFIEDIKKILNSSVYKESILKLKRN